MKLSRKIFRINQEIANELYRQCNELYFNYRLNFIPVYITYDKSYFGEFTFDIDFKHKLLYNEHINISIFHMRTIEEFRKTMIHELAHYKVFSEIPEKDIIKAFTAYDNNEINIFNEMLYLDDYAHLNKWKNIINDINNTYNLKIN